MLEIGGPRSDFRVTTSDLRRLRRLPFQPFRAAMRLGLGVATLVSMKDQVRSKLTVSCFAVRMPVRLSGTALPTRKLVLPWGVSNAIDGPVVLDESTVATFAAFQAAKGFDKVALDFEHNTVKGTPANLESREPRDIAAFGVPMLVPGEGLYLDAMEWTPKGPEQSANYCDLSPALIFRPGTRTVMGLHSVALTRAGAIAGVRAFSVDLTTILTTPQGDKTMERTVLLALLGLADAATDEDILAAAKTLGATLKTMCAEDGDVAAMSAQAVKGSIEGLAARLQNAEAKIIVFDAARAASDRETIIDQSKREGKVLPFSADALKTVDLATLREVAANTPSTIPLDQRTVETHKVDAFDAASRGVVTGDVATSTTVARFFGRTPADLSRAGM